MKVKICLSFIMTSKQKFNKTIRGILNCSFGPIVLVVIAPLKFIWFCKHGNFIRCFSTLINLNSNFGFEFRFKFDCANCRIRWGYKLLVHQVINWRCSVLGALSTLVTLMSSTLNFLSHTDESCKQETRVCGNVLKMIKNRFLKIN